jgi:hypothetical protein
VDYQKDLLKTVVAEKLKELELHPKGDDVSVVHEQLVRALSRRNRRLTELDHLSVEELEEQVLRDGLMGVFLTAEELRRFKASLLARRENWFPRFWSHLLEYLYGQHGYTLRCSLESLGHHPSDEPVEVTCPEGHTCKIAPQDFARRVRCGKCPREPNDQEVDRVETLRVLSEYVSGDGYLLGRTCWNTNHAQRQNNTDAIQTAWLVSICLSNATNYVHCSDAQLLDYLKTAFVTLQRTPTAQDIDSLPKFPCAVQYYKRFGTLNNALKLAGVPIARHSHLTCGVAIAEIQRMRVELGHVPSSQEWNCAAGKGGCYPTYSTVLAALGVDSWSDALKAAELDPEDITRRMRENRRLSDVGAVTDLRRVFALLGRSFTRNDYDKLGRFSGGCVGAHFGTWNKALLAAGLPAHRLVGPIGTRHSHGDYRKYNHEKCRCRRCKEAWNLYCREKRAAKKDAR